ncbi:MAG: serine protease [Thermodesulfobacteriota bacterium]|nr:MAG: serine protease [Thermodesulfobacteriota bacterium]
MLRALSILLIIFSLISFYFSYADTKNKKEAAQTKTNESEQELKQTPEVGEIVLIEINGTINPATLDYIRAGFEEAEKESASALIILLDTPGGLLTSTKEIVKLLLNSPIPSVVYVSPSGASATSAGVFITLAANVAAMAPGTSIGAAAPVSLSPGGRQPDKKDQDPVKKLTEKNDKESETVDNTKSNQDVMSEKIENYASSFIESIAEHRGRNVEWAIDAVRESDSITATEALELKVIDLISPSLSDLKFQIDGMKVKVPQGEITLQTKNAQIVRVEMSIKQKLIDILSTPDIAFLLLSLGSLGLLLEFYNPGLIFPGAAGVVCLMLGFVSFQILPFNYAGVVLLVLALALFITEVYVTSFGLLTAGGAISFALGALLLFDTPDSDIRVGYGVVIASTAAIALFFGYVLFYLIKAQNLRPQVGMESITGEVGDAVSDISESGKVYVMGEYWDAVSDEFIKEGDKIKVVESQKGFKLKVEKVIN